MTLWLVLWKGDEGAFSRALARDSVRVLVLSGVEDFGRPGGVLILFHSSSGIVFPHRTIHPLNPLDARRKTSESDHLPSCLAGAYLFARKSLFRREMSPHQFDQ